MKTLIALLLLLPFAALSQEIQFTAETTSGNGEVVPVLSWETTPAADSCVASGGWSGEKGASGTETLAAISGSATYNLTCTWLSDGNVTLKWLNPTENTDGTPYTDPGWTIIEYSPDGQDPWFIEIVTDPAATTIVIENLAPGDWTFRALAVNTSETKSDPSNLAVKIIEPPSETSDSIGITVNPQPKSPTGLTAE